MTNDSWTLSAVASLVEELDKKLLVMLRDGSKILGTLRSFDQFANIVLQDAVERIIVGSSYSDIPLGLYIVRGENVVLMGEVDEATETQGLTMVDNDEIKRAREAEKAAEKLKGEMLSRMDFLQDLE
jgi:U6 snRNA-associated Sm-like protein LSm1|uniref:U6 snRNA-associated Sm-like protein LSm1 n=1 Tax=Micromonas pusilla TaxID=38833 RepID=A0A6U0E5S4_MICPS|eukprot:CAMPEP_0203001470 /NCGR_PEP_ID=MMETSP1401-20130829/585_1 /ASSEMBLY_ACC=CAM_ASM_000894 /TAXON_ID=38833 /ORGANISM="Micromonas pusilla, Strain CCAC1681" /LENGTH=126 /DNA_ID=CAMNT_0049742943 /DNA_START=26 /DNA_END=406 /DNA_ORIENTATION=+